MKPAALGIIYNADRTQVLLIERRDIPVFVLPGGGIEEGEMPEQAAVREVWEETGLRVEVVRQVAEYTPLNRLAELTYVFECRQKDGLLRTGCETTSLNFYGKDQLPKNLFIVHRAWLEDAFANKPDVIRKYIEQVTYLALVKYFFRHPIHVMKHLIAKSKS